MGKVILDDALRSRLDLTNGPTELCDAGGKAVAVVLPTEEYMRLLYDLAWAEASTPEAEAERAASEEQIRRGECVTSAELFAQIDAFMRTRAAS